MDKQELDRLQAICDAATEAMIKLVCDWTPHVGTARFISTARTAMPKLIARVRELEKAMNFWNAEYRHRAAEIEARDACIAGLRACHINHLMELECYIPEVDNEMDAETRTDKVIARLMDA